MLRRWMDPDGDGDPADGVDGWRLDAAEKVPHGFWRRFRREVKRINPDAAILGEIWTDATAWVSGDQFDAVTNYPFSARVVEFVNQDASYSRATRFVDQLDELIRRHDWTTTCAMANLIGSHDTPRSVTMLHNAARHPAVVQRARRVSPADTRHPGVEAFRRLRLAALIQFTWPGAPMIYYGDEVGMYGGNDPFCRAPMWWREHSPPGLQPDLHRLYSDLAQLRSQRSELRRGACRVLLADDARGVLAFDRRDDHGESIIVINTLTKLSEVSLNLKTDVNSVNWNAIYISEPSGLSPKHGKVAVDSAGRVRFELSGLGACILVSRDHGKGADSVESER